MRWVRHFFALLSCTLMVPAAEFHLVTGDVYKGELSASDRDGIIVRLESGDFSPRIDWAKLSDETLKELAENPRAKKFVEPFLEPPAETVALQQAKEIPVRQPSRPELPDVKKGLISALTATNGLLLLGALYFANLYAAYEIARFRWRPVALVCGLSAIFPLLGPIIFLALPRQRADTAEGATQSAAAQTHLGVPPPAAATSGMPSGGAAAALGISKTSSAASQLESLPKIFKRGEFTFNRRFFETQFPTFFRVVTTEADKDLVIEVSAGKKGVTAARISRISASEIGFKTPTNQEIGVPFSDITEVKLRHKDAA